MGFNAQVSPEGEIVLSARDFLTILSKPTWAPFVPTLAQVNFSVDGSGRYAKRISIGAVRLWRT